MSVLDYNFNWSNESQQPGVDTYGFKFLDENPMADLTTEGYELLLPSQALHPAAVPGHDETSSPCNEPGCEGRAFNSKSGLR
jgi:hypothetical protein